MKTRIQKEKVELEVLWFAAKDINPFQCRLQKLVKESKFCVRNWNLFFQVVLIIRLNHLGVVAAGGYRKIMWTKDGGFGYDCGLWTTSPLKAVQ